MAFRYFLWDLQTWKTSNWHMELRQRTKYIFLCLHQKLQNVKIPLDFGKEIEKVSVIYPNTVDCKFYYDENELCVELPQEKCARLFEVDLK